MSTEQSCGACKYLDRRGLCDAPVSRLIESELPICYERRLMWRDTPAENCPRFDRKESAND